MSEPNVLEIFPDLGSGNMGFPDLKKHLNSDLEAAQNIPDLEQIILKVGRLLKSGKLSFEEKSEFKRLRQRAYDWKRKPKYQNPRSEPKEPQIFEVSRSEDQVSEADKSDPNLNPDEKSKSVQIPRLSEASTLKSIAKEENNLQERAHLPRTIKTEPSLSKSNLVNGMKSAFLKIDGEKLVKRLPRILLSLGSATLVSVFFWLQSLNLYQSVGFSNPALTAVGGLFMVIGFAAYYSLTNSKLALLLCVYAGVYEGYFIISGTHQDEVVTATEQIESNQELLLLKEEAERTKSSYYKQKLKYESPDSKVFENSWFKEKYLDPSWSKYKKSHQEYLSKKDRLKSSFNSNAWLKVLYRLGLVFLCMILVHNFFHNFK